MTFVGKESPKEVVMRDSNMELLRIVAMLLVAVVHCNFLPLGMPGRLEISAAPASAFMRYFTQSVSVICVDLFVLISGWYGIRPTRMKLLRLIFDVAFVQLLTFTIACAINPTTTLSVRSIKYFFLIADDLWFIKAYVFLFILAPILNAFVEKASKSLFRNIVAAFMIFQLYFGWITPGVVWFNHGYSGASFMGLYLLARYLRLYCSTSVKTHYLAIIAVTSVMLCTVVSYVLMYFDIRYWACICHSYIGLFTLATATSVLLFFNRLHFTSKLVNEVAPAMLTVYLFHCSPFLFEYYLDNVKSWFATLPTTSFVVRCAIQIAVVFCLAYLIYRISRFLWVRFVSLRFCNSKKYEIN